jgi:hypothetical protein
LFEFHHGIHALVLAPLSAPGSAAARPAFSMKKNAAKAARISVACPARDYKM